MDAAAPFVVTPPGLGVVWLVLLAGFTLLWVASLPLRNASIVDMWWGPAFVVAGATYLLARPDAGVRAAAVLSFVSAWALRLAWHIGRRNIGHGEDPRYAAWRRANGGSWWWFSWVKVFALQATVAWLVSWPIGVALASTPPFPSWWDLAGLGIAVAGLVTEAAADRQLRRFKATAAPGAVCDSGLWRYSRHPNYFGESVVWWGLWLVAAGVPGGWWTIVSPLVMTWLLLRVSGVTLLERGLLLTKPAYAAYVRRTSAFVPRSPRP